MGQDPVVITLTGPVHVRVAIADQLEKAQLMSGKRVMRYREAPPEKLPDCDVVILSGEGATWRKS